MSDCAENGRMVALAWQEARFGNGPGSTLPEICMALRAGVNGMADPWDTDDIRSTVAMLGARLKTWRHQAAERYAALDEAVRGMVEATVAEVKGYAWWQERK